jgi:hypothetical protein
MTYDICIWAYDIWAYVYEKGIKRQCYGMKKALKDNNIVLWYDKGIKRHTTYNIIP